MVVKNPFYFKVRLHDDNTNCYWIETGIGAAGSYTDAIEKLECKYGYKLNAIHHLEILEDDVDSMLVLPEVVCEQIINHNFNTLPVYCDEKGNKLEVS